MHLERLKGPIRLLIGLLILVFWAQVLRENWRTLLDYSWQISWPLLALSLVLLMGQIILLGLIWWRGLVLVGGELGGLRGIAIWLQTQMARYLPGGIWDMAGRVALSREQRVSMTAVSVSLGLEIGLQILSAALFLTVALLYRMNAQAQAYLPMVIGLMFVTFVLLAPPLFGRLLNFGLKLLRRPAVSVGLSWADLILLFLARIVAHGLLGVGFLLFVQGIAPVDPSLGLLLISGYVGAWLIGFLALPVPTGIGVREGVLLFLLGGALPPGPVTAAAIGYRIWLTGRDLLAGLLGIWLSRHADDRADRGAR